MEDLVFFLYVYLGVGFFISYFSLIALSKVEENGKGLLPEGKPLISLALGLMFWWPIFVIAALKGPREED